MGVARKEEVVQKAIHSHSTGHGINDLTQTMSKKCSVKRIFLTAQVRRGTFFFEYNFGGIISASTKATLPSTAKQFRGLAHCIYNF